MLETKATVSLLQQLERLFSFLVFELNELLTTVQDNGYCTHIFLYIFRTAEFMIVSQRIKIHRGKVGSEQLLDHIRKYFKDTLDGDVLRFAIVGTSGAALVVDVSIKVEDATQKTKKTAVSAHMANQFIVAHIIPTGVKADIGGYVGDATPATNVIAAIADKVISHPNVVNGVALNLARKNVLYVEGYAPGYVF